MNIKKTLKPKNLEEDQEFIDKEVLNNLEQIKKLVEMNIFSLKKLTREKNTNFKSRKLIGKYESLLGILSQIKKIQ